MHYYLIVIGNGSLRDMMAPFSENLEVPEYCNGRVHASDLQRFLDYCNEQTKGRHYSMDDLDELYAEKGDDWNDSRWRKAEDGEWYEYCTWNPKSKWDWYEVGGRWAGQLEVKDDAETEPVHFSWGWSEEDKRTVLDAKPRRADIARKGDIINLDTLHAYAVLIDGEWIEAEGFNDTLQISDYLDGVSDDTLITSVDYHF